MVAVEFRGDEGQFEEFLHMPKERQKIENNLQLERGYNFENRKSVCRCG